MISKVEIKYLTRLHLRKYRKHHGQFILEGARLIKEALAANVEISKLWHVPWEMLNNIQKTILRSAKTKNIILEETEFDDLSKISDTVHHQGLIGIAALPEVPSLKGTADKSILYLEEIRDPGNLGTLFRTAWWFGIEHVTLSPKCVDPYNPKVVRAGMGAHFNLSIYPQVELGDLSALGYTILVADQGGKPLTEIHFNKRIFCLVMGSEAHGVSQRSRTLASELLAIPRVNKAESLNVAVAAGILLFSLTQNT
ncbi:MAG: TrmH family RNA methyltransferase [Fidelibacterota bacterium]